MADEYKWITTDRKGQCAYCETQLQTGERVLWSLIDKRKVWCKKCGTDIGSAPKDEEGKGINNRAEASTGNGASVGATTNACARARWELVAGDDGIIVLRKTDGEKR